MSKGKELLEVYKVSGEAAFKKALAKHLVKLDTERWGGLIFEIKRLGSVVTDKQLLKSLENKQGQITKDKLRRALGYYKYTGLITVEGEKVRLRVPVLRNLMKGLDTRVSASKFVKTLLSAYERLQAGTGRSPYVSIPELREAVCEEIGFWPDDFYELLKEIPKETSQYLIHLSQPMERKPGGLKLGGKYLFYIAIYKKKEGE
jgi:hypothetical protein